MPLESSSRLLGWFANYNQNSVLGCIVYEMFGLNDAFGRVMINNLKASYPYRFLDTGSPRMIRSVISLYLAPNHFPLLKVCRIVFSRLDSQLPERFLSKKLEKHISIRRSLQGMVFKFRFIP